MQYLPSINTIRNAGIALLQFCFPPDDIDRAADMATLDDIAQKMRPKQLAHPHGATTLFSYDEPYIRSLIYAMKYRNRKGVAELFGECLGEYLLPDIESIGMIIPVPLSTKKKRSRGYNQSEIIAKSVMARLQSDHIVLETRALIRTRDTESQTKQKSKAARLENMRYAFAVAKSAHIAGRSILLIDDVATTGATLSDARRALRDAGAAEVRMLVIASGQ